MCHKGHQRPTSSRGVFLTQQQLIDELQTDLNCTDEFRKFLNIIEMQMIIVQEDNTTSHLTAPNLQNPRRSSSGNIGSDVGTLWYAIRQEMNCPISP
jgi:hypothetical protein